MPELHELELNVKREHRAEGLTLADLMSLVQACLAYDMSANARIRVRIGIRKQLLKVTITDRPDPDDPNQDGPVVPLCGEGR